MKQVRFFLATMLLAGVGSVAFMVSDWTKDTPGTIVSEVSAASLNENTNVLFQKELGDCPFYVDGKCYTCDAPEAFSVDSAEECAKCPNRKAIYTGGAEIESWACASLTCPQSHPINAEWGNCFSCDETRAIDYFPENGDTGANACPNRVLNEGALALKQCPSSHPLIDPLGGCYKCDEIQDVYTSPENCKECSNRSFEPMSHVGRCYLKQ